MKKITVFVFFLTVLLLSSSVFSAEGVITVLDISQDGIAVLTPQDSKLTFNSGIKVDTGTKGQWPGFVTKGLKWNFSESDALIFDVSNHGAEKIRLHCRLDSPEVDHKTMTGTYTHWFEVEAGQRTQAKVPLPSRLPPQLAEKLFGMRGYPGGVRGQGNVGSAKAFHKDAVVSMVVFLNQPGKETSWTVHGVTAAKGKQAEWSKLSADAFFPFIDKFGQFKYDNWQGKVHSEDELKQNIGKEELDLEKNPSPKDRNQYGGYTAGKKYEVTGQFRVEKIDGVWWFIDPEGCLFWSHGTDCVITGNAVTPITDREFYFEGLPPKDDPVFKACYGTGNWAPHNYYEGRGTYVTFNFTRANLIRKYGSDWQNIHAKLAHQRLKSWGMNTIANWSDRSIYELRKTPYTATINSGGKRIEGSGGYWGKFFDTFSKEFEETVDRNVKNTAAYSADDPWCLGYFVDNEISWGGERSLAVGTITSPADQPAKIVFVNDLKEKYGDIKKLNAVWGTAHADWNALLASTNKPDETKAKEDLDFFHRKVAEKYFSTIHAAIKKYAPKKMYFGCRFAWGNETAIRVSANYCDVISFNKYQRTLTEFKLPEGIDKPVIIGEFHFGALDRGMFHTGLVPTESQEKRAEAYYEYVASALRNPLIIGTHWFQYGDQATTGRGDGENYQIGLLNVCDTPYPETISAVRKVGYNLYDMRLKSGK
ncbi:MAG: beta-galactosidase [Planctomycetaceae bacterium]|nr:beta-galactosidase [Planctomycetaceae bacterium]